MTNPAPAIFSAILGLASIGTLINSAYIVNEGNVGVITHLGQAIRQETPSGLRFKVPFLQGLQEFDVRERVMSGEMTATTSNQLSSSLRWSMNWRPDPAEILNIYVNYGGPDEFAANVLVPRLNQALRAAIGQHTAVQLSTSRNDVAATMFAMADDALDSYPIFITSIQLDDFTLPEVYWNAVLEREQQREVTERERLVLEQQQIRAQQAVQTAEAEAQASRARADAAAYAVRVAAEADAAAMLLLNSAEAEGIEAVQAAISQNPLFIEYFTAQQWNGQLPAQMIPSTSLPFISVDPIPE